MLHALLKRKLRVVDPNIEYRDVEDHLTAAVLARICYLSPPLAADLIEGSMVEQRFGRPDSSKAGHGDEEMWIEFWPRFADPTSSQCIVEPDAILGIGSHTYVVEAKRTDDWGQTAEQAARNWLSFCKGEVEEGDDVEEDIAGTVLLLGGIADTGRFSVLAEETHQRILSQKDGEAEEASPVPRIAWVSWAKFASTVRDFIQVATPQEARVLEDINLALTHHGFGDWVTFTQLSRVIDSPPIHIGLDPLPTFWPSPPKLTPALDQQRSTLTPNPIDEWRQLSSTVKIMATPSQFPVLSPLAQSWKSKT